MRAWWLVFLMGCVDSSSVLCGTDQLCPSGSTCSHLTAPDEDICATSEQIEQCAEAQEGDSCTVRDAPPSWCHDKVCIPIVCGNLRVDATETCDDGNTQSGDRSCSADCSSDETCGNGVLDPLVRDGTVVSLNEECDDGNALTGDGCSSGCRNEVARWSRIAEVPVPQMGGAVAFDPVRQRIVMFGGQTDDNPTDGFFEWNGRNWASIATSLRPSPRRFPTMTYDTARRRLVLFGGHIGEADAPLGDTWEWDGTNWTLLSPVTSPPPRTNATMVYDSARKKTVLFGGFTNPVAGVGNARPSDDTWEWDGTTWTQNTAATHPPTRHHHVMAYDPKRAVTVMAGGYDHLIDMNGTVYRRDTWEYNGTWTQVTGAPAPADLDSGSTLAYDPVASRMIAFGGIQPDPNTVSPRTWSYSGTTWTDLGQGTPLMRHHASLATDYARDRVVLFGGNTSTSTDFVDTTWLWNGSTWGTPAVTPFVSPARVHASTTRDPLRGITWLFGGLGAIGDDLLSFDGTTWMQHTATGPTSRIWPGLAYDPLRDELVMFGGSTIVQGNLTPNNETWTFDGTSWTPRTPTTSPTPRFGPAMYFDPNRGRVVLFSGESPLDDSDLWEWTGTTWEAIAVATAPEERAVGTVAFDAARGVCVLYSGITTTALKEFDDVWHFDGTTWTRDAAATPLPDRLYPKIAYNPAHQSVFEFGGASQGGEYFADTWQWVDNAWKLLSLPQSPPARGAHAMFPAGNGNGIVLMGGQVQIQEVPIVGADTWLFRYESTTRNEQCALDVDDDEDGLSGCDDPDCWAVCTPLCPPNATTCPDTYPRCGDLECNTALESCRNCPTDCTTCPDACGDGFCDAPETLATCPGDCTP